MSSQRIGVLGGTFDPVHNGHLSVAGMVQEVFELDTVVFIPAYEPPHKQSIRLTPFTDRLAMLKQAVIDIPFFQVSAIEAGRLGPSYSIDTLQHLKKELSTSTELFFIIGSDAFAEIASWKSYVKLPEFAHFIVIARAPFIISKLDSMIQQLFPDYAFDRLLNCWRKSDCPGCFYLVIIEPILVSSTEIRQRVRQGLDITSMVPPQVVSYIKANNLYGTEGSLLK